MKKIFITLLVIFGLSAVYGQATERKYATRDSASQYTAVIELSNQFYLGGIVIPYASLNSADSMYFKVGNHPDSLYYLTETPDSTIYVITPRTQGSIAVKPTLFYTWKYMQIWFDTEAPDDQVYPLIPREY